MSDLISRQAAVDAIEKLRWERFTRGDYFQVFAVDALEEATLIIKSLPSVQQEQRWIPVSERLPETDGYYLVTIKTFGWNGEQYEDVDIARYERKNGWLKADKCTAWMPLPPIFREEES